MDNIYFFNAHGSRNDLTTRVYLPESDRNIYITLAYPGYVITGFELLLCLCAFKNERFVEWFNSKIELIRTNKINGFAELYFIERQVESKIIQTGWEQAKTFLTQPNASTYPDYESIKTLVRLMNEHKLDDSIDINAYKKQTAFFLTFYFRNPTFNLSIADYSYSTHIYSNYEIQRSGLNPMSTYNYDLEINIPERKFNCDKKGQKQVSKLIERIYEQSIIPTKNELKKRFKLQCVNGEHLAISNYSIDSTSQFINYVNQRFRLDTDSTNKTANRMVNKILGPRLNKTLDINSNVIFMANCSKVKGLDNDSIELVRSNSFTLRDLPSLDDLPVIKDSSSPDDSTTFNKPKRRPQAELQVNHESEELQEPSTPEPYSTQELPKPEPYSNQDPEVYNTYFSSNNSFWPKKIFGSKMEKYSLETKKVYEDKKKLAKKVSPINSNIIVTLYDELLVPSFDLTFSPEGGDNFYILSSNSLDSNLAKIIANGLAKTIELNISVTPESIIFNWFLMYFTSIQNFFNNPTITNDSKASDFYNYYLCRIQPDSKNIIMDMFVEQNNISTETLQSIINNPTDQVNFEYIQTFISSQPMRKFIYDELGLTVSPTKKNHFISQSYTFETLTNGSWKTITTPIHPINYWFIKINEKDVDFKVVKTNSVTKSKYLKYKEKYLNYKQALSL